MKMAYLDMTFPASAQHLLLASYRKVAQVHPGRVAIAAALIAIGTCRLLPASYLQGIDSLIGRPGDAVLLAAVLLLVAASLVPHRPVTWPQSRTFEPAAAILDHHLRLDQEIDNSLNAVIGDTEDAALAIIGQVRQLYDTAKRLVAYLDDSSLKVGDLGKEITNSVAYVVEIGAFIEQLPAKMERDLDSVQMVVKEIKDLGGLVDAVQAISMQSHLLAINAAIEASRAGSAGATFRVVANEMQALASNSSAVAVSISQGLSRARLVVEEGMESSIAQTKKQLGEVSLAASSIQKLLDNFEDINQYNKTRFAVLTQHNGDLARDIAEVLGQVQFQDVVRQCIERIRFAIGQRNAIFQDAVGLASQGGAALAPLPQRLELILNNYLIEEEKHSHSARSESDSGGELKIELF